MRGIDFDEVSLGLEQGKQPPLLDIVEPSKKWPTGEHHTRSFENIQVFDKGKPQNQIKRKTQDKIN